MPYAENAGTRIYWEAEGSGEPLLLIMGMGYTSALWYRLRPLMARHYRTLVFDNRGVGQSEAPEGPYQIHTLAADALAVLEAAGAEQAHVLGLSLGGMMAQELVLAHPQRVRALVLGATGCGGEQAVPPTPKVRELLETARLKMGSAQLCNAFSALIRL